MAGQEKTNIRRGEKRDDFSPIVKTAKQILRFLNAARTPDDIANVPEAMLWLGDQPVQKSEIWRLT